MKLLDKVAIVTGGSGFIGRSIVEELVKEGADVVFTYLKDKADADNLVLKTKSYDRKVIGLQCDVKNSEDVKRVIDFTIREFKKIDILVNNAGIGSPSPIENTTNMDWENIINVNLRGSYLTSREVSRYMKNQKYGKIVNISSTGGLFGIKHYSIHGASKAGLIGFTKNLALELGEFNINVNSIAPGTIRDESKFSRDYISQLIDGIPLKRIGNPKDISSVVVFLCSDDSSYITGEVIVVDGGKSVLW